MAKDLVEHFERIRWAIIQTKLLRSWVQEYESSKPYRFEYRKDEQTQLTDVWVYATAIPSPVFRVQVGAIIHELRSALDALACTLAIRNGKAPGTTTYFPICLNKEAFSKSQAQKKISLLSLADKAVIEALEPWSGGDELLYALHRADITCKHQRLLLAASASLGAGFHAPVGFGIMDILPGRGNLEDGVLISRVELPENVNFNVKVQICFSEPRYLAGTPIADAADQLAEKVYSILKKFD